MAESKAVIEAWASQVLQPLGWEWHTMFDIDRLAWRFVAIPTEAWRDFYRGIDPMDMRQDGRVEGWIKEHGVQFDLEPTEDRTEYFDGMRLLVKRALEKANA